MFLKMWGIFWLTEERLASQEGPFFHGVVAGSSETVISILYQFLTMVEVIFHRNFVIGMWWFCFDSRLL